MAKSPKSKSYDASVEGDRQFVSKEPLMAPIQRLSINVKSGVVSIREVMEPVEFAYDAARKHIIVNPSFKAPQTPSNKGNNKQGGKLNSPKGSNKGGGGNRG